MSKDKNIYQFEKKGSVKSFFSGVSSKIDRNPAISDILHGAGGNAAIFASLAAATVLNSPAIAITGVAVGFGLISKRCLEIAANKKFKYIVKDFLNKRKSY